MGVVCAEALDYIRVAGAGCGRAAAGVLTFHTQAPPATAAVAPRHAIACIEDRAPRSTSGCFRGACTSALTVAGRTAEAVPLRVLHRRVVYGGRTTVAVLRICRRGKCMCVRMKRVWLCHFTTSES